MTQHQRQLQQKYRVLVQRRLDRQRSKRRQSSNAAEPSGDMTFKPILNAKSIELSSARSPQQQYERFSTFKKEKDMKRMELKAQKENNELSQCTFKPLLEKSSKEFIESKLQKRESLSSRSRI